MRCPADTAQRLACLPFPGRPGSPRVARHGPDPLYRWAPPRQSQAGILACSQSRQYVRPSCRPSTTAFLVRRVPEAVVARFAGGGGVDDALSALRR